MYTYFIFIADLDPWRQQRIVSACQAFLEILDPTFDIEPLDLEPLDLDGVRVGWFFYVSAEKVRQHLTTFFTGLVGPVGHEQTSGGAIGRGRSDAPTALDFVAAR